MAHYFADDYASDEEKARLFQHGSNGAVVDMITLVKELAERQGVTTVDVIVRVQDAQGQHLGHHCARGGTAHCRAALVRCLMEFTSSQKTLQWVFLDGSDRAGNSPSMIAARHGHALMLTTLATRGASIHLRNNAREGILHQAVQAHSTETLETAFALGAEPDSLDVQHQTPLHYAAYYNDLEACKILLDNLACPSAVDKLQGYTALHVAAKAGYADIVEVLLANDAYPDAETEEGTTALHLAATGGHPAVVALLLGKGANVNSQDSICRTPLHAAARSKKEGALGCVELLLASSHVKPELKDSTWKTAEELAHGQEHVLAAFKRMANLNRD
ncbi:ankyrin repeat containing protein [Apiospora aurea]|uniref:Ankyrin repeat containing protein n=1 Tax=Apiospora aurea TaxID=335848 RepID=A0ABR1QBI6_9PEZI